MKRGRREKRETSEVRVPDGAIGTKPGRGSTIEALTICDRAL